MSPTWNGKLALMALTAMLAACEAGQPSNEEATNEIVGDTPAEPAPSPPAGADNDSKGTPDPDPGREPGAVPGGSAGNLPPAGQGPRFVGRWAAEADLCSTTAWRFTQNSLRTPAGSVCPFSKVTPVAGGYDIAARCTAEGPPANDVLEIRFAESARAMLFESDSIADAGLIYCGTLD